MIKKILVLLRVIMVESNEQRQKDGLKCLGRGYSSAYRLNPYNPISYVVLFLVVIVGILIFGIVGFWKEVDMCNPFKWN